MQQILTEKALWQAYVQQIGWRLKMQTCRRINPFRLSVRRTAQKLQDARLAELYMEAQFASFPADWCQEAYRQSYPPPAVVFGEGSWDRYQQYLEEGVVQ